MTIFTKNRFVYYQKFDDGFECRMDKKGRIWIKHNENDKWSSPCMKLCYDLIFMRNKVVAKEILARSCEIQNDEAITERATMYRSV